MFVCAKLKIKTENMGELQRAGEIIKILNNALVQRLIKLPQTFSRDRDRCLFQVRCLDLIVIVT